MIVQAHGNAMGCHLTGRSKPRQKVSSGHRIRLLSLDPPPTGRWTSTVCHAEDLDSIAPGSLCLVEGFIRTRQQILRFFDFWRRVSSDSKGHGNADVAEHRMVYMGVLDCGPQPLGQCQGRQDSGTEQSCPLRRIVTSRILTASSAERGGAVAGMHVLP